jgi:hypothetical protein
MRHLDITKGGPVTEEVLTDPLVTPDGSGTTPPPVNPDGATTTPPVNPDGGATTPPVNPDGATTTTPPVNPDNGGREQGGGSSRDRDRDRDPDQGGEGALMPGERLPDPPGTSGTGNLSVIATSTGDTSPPIFVGGVEKRAGRYRDEVAAGTYQIKVVCPGDSSNPGWAPVKGIVIEAGGDAGLRVDCDTKSIEPF